MCRYLYAHFCAVCIEGLSSLNPLQTVYLYLLVCCSPEVVDNKSDHPKFRAVGKGWVHSYAELELCYLSILWWKVSFFHYLDILGKSRLRNSNREFFDLTLIASKVCMCDGGNEGGSFSFDISNIFL